MINCKLVLYNRLLEVHVSMTFMTKKNKQSIIIIISCLNSQSIIRGQLWHFNSKIFNLRNIIFMIANSADDDEMPRVSSRSSLLESSHSKYSTLWILHKMVKIQVLEF